MDNRRQGIKLSHKVKFLVVLLYILLPALTYGEVDWTAYNDCAGSTSSNANTTVFTDYNGYGGVISGLLKDDTTGSTAGMPTVTFTIPTDTTIQPRIDYDSASNPSPGTDADVIFDGKVDFSGTILQHPASCGAECWFVEIKFTNLTPSKKYTFIGSAFRDSTATDRETQCTIQGAEAFTNNSSDGVELKSGDTTIFRACGNSDSDKGYVVRWDDIEPGADGEFSIYTVSADSDGRQGYPLHGFMLQQVDVSINDAPIVDAGGDQTITLPREYLTLNGAVSDDGLGIPADYLESTWSQVSGPATVEFVTDIHQPQVTVHFPAPGVYQLQLYATDGELSDSEVVTITVADPVCPVGDTDGDCIVSLSDLGLIALNWLDNTGTSMADLDGDTWVKMQELSLVGQSWLENWTGSLHVTILPAEAAAAGAQWRVDGGAWYSSGATVVSLPEGSHDIEYSIAVGWSAPGTETVQITRQQTTVASGQYHKTSDDIVINEFMAINSYVPSLNPLNIYTRYDWLPSTDYVYPDWIEIRNTGSESHNLAGWYLTDDPGNLTKWQFPSDMDSELVLGPNEYYVLFASNKEQTLFPMNYPYVDSDGALHTNFELGANGEYLAIVAPDGVSVSHEYNDYPKQFPFTTYGIASDDTLGYLTPTPGDRVFGQWSGAANSTAYMGKVADTNFSHGRGFYESALNVIISCDTAGAAIHYTLDGTEPQPTVGGSTLLYDGPVNISTTTCLRAKAFKSGWLASNVDTQTYLFLNDVVEQVKPADSRYVTVWGQDDNDNDIPADYEMENDTSDISLVAGDETYTVEEAKEVIKNALQQIPTLSVTTDPDNLFDGSIGIYTHTSNSGLNWERPVSAEYFGSDPNDTFQIDCGLRLQGGASRNPSRSPKHSLSLRFRGGYGDAKLKTDILEPQTDVGEYDTLQLRAMYNNSWIHGTSSQRDKATMTRDQLVRDFLIAMGQESAGAGTYVHLYLNGLYWGVYNMHERQEASHYAAYYGGDSDYYDATNGGGIIDGDGDQWGNMQSTVDGANPSSQTDWEAINAVLDVENYIDWTIIQHFAKNIDLKTGGNWRSAGGGVFGSPWQYYAWDTENCLNDGSVNDPRTDGYDDNLPFLLGPLRAFEEFRIQFADRLYKHLRNQGTLTYTSTSEIFNMRVTELNDAIIAESARWGDYRRDVRGDGYLYTRNDFWVNAVSNIHGYLLAKETNALPHFQNDFIPPLYPSIEPPVYTINSVELPGGDVPIPCTFDMDNNGTGDVYYTLDGTDPRQYWTGNVSGTAILFDGTPIQFDKSVTVKARVKDGTIWSALHEATYVDEQIINSLRITELMYHPAAADPNTEFIELKNIGAEAINLNLVHFTDGIDFTFGDVTLVPGGYTVVVQDRGAFEDKYGTSLSVTGQYSGSLSNGGEEIVLRDALGTEIHDFDYKDGWYDLTDGLGFSLTLINPDSTDPNDWDSKIGWRSSVYAGGTPGAAPEAALAAGSIVINEILAHSHATDPDWIELYNTTGSSINIGGWFLSDNNDDDPNLMKYQIPDGTMINAYDYKVFVEDTSFGDLTPTGNNVPFGLSEAGETVYLHSGEAGQLTGLYQTEENFDASETGVTFGRYEKTELSGGYDFTRMASVTQGDENDGPLIPDIVITEIHYNPPEGTDYAFVELYNHSGSPVTLMSQATTETSPGVFVTENIPWRLEGTGYEFPTNTIIPAYSYLVVAKNTANYGGSIGPFDGTLSKGGEQIEIQIPGDWEYGQLKRYWIPIEKVDYDDETPWPTSPDGSGDSLQRNDVTAYGRDYSNWTPATPTPGS